MGHLSCPPVPASSWVCQPRSSTFPGTLLGLFLAGVPHRRLPRARHLPGLTACHCRAQRGVCQLVPHPAAGKGGPGLPGRHHGELKVCAQWCQPLRSGNSMVPGCRPLSIPPSHGTHHEDSAHQPALEIQLIVWFN